MTRRGKCRCGAVLQFRKTAQGYKTRCPACSAVVRLRADGAESGSPRPKKSSPVLASGPPPLPAEPTDASVESLPPGSMAPMAVAEIEVDESSEPASGAQWWVLALAAGGVIVAVGAAAMLWG